MFKYIDLILNKAGYYKSVMPKGAKVKEAEVLEMFKEYGGSQTFKQLLVDLTEADKVLYFQASNDDDRSQIRGAIRRTNYFISLIQKANDKR